MNLWRFAFNSESLFKTKQKSFSGCIGTDTSLSFSCLNFLVFGVDAIIEKAYYLRIASIICVQRGRKVGFFWFLGFFIISFLK